MATVISDRSYTPADLLTLPNGKHFELVDGQLVRSEMSAISCRVVMRVSTLMDKYVDEHRLGSVFASELGYQCFPDDPLKIRKPDVSFIRQGRLTADMLSGHVPIAPDLAIEVVSEHDSYWDVEEKVDEYLHAGVTLVWVFNPNRRTMRVFRKGRPTIELDESGELSGDDVLPGFRIPIAPLFERPAIGSK